MTERKKAEQQLFEAREQLYQSQKMDSIGQLTSGIAHDFNNLLTVILSGTQMVERMAHGNERLLTVLGHMRHAVERGEKLTRQLLTYSRRQTLKPELLDVSAALHSFSEGMLQTLRGNIEFTLEIQENLWPVEADANELDLAIINIAINARDAMSQGGQLWLRARNEEKDLNVCGVPAHYVAISLTDTGIGMSREPVAKATEPFFTTKPSGSGTGLGLSQALGFAKQSGGSLQIESTHGKGTSVTIYLPAAKASTSELQVLSPGKGLTVLVVEDEVLVAEMAMSVLSQAGYSVELAYDAKKGLEILRTMKVDGVFTDIVMPGGMNGIKFAETIRGEFPQLPVLLTSGYYQLPESRGLRHPVLRKPYDETALLTALEKLFSTPSQEIYAAP